MAALSLATELGMGQPLEQALRDCLLALELGRRTGCTPAERSDVYYVALLEHLGCSANAPEVASWNGGDDIAFRTTGIAFTHASTLEFGWHLAHHVGDGLPLARRARLLAGGVAGAEHRFATLVALQCEAATCLAMRLGLGPGVQRALRQVYERWDGGGAPDGASGTAISRAQRVVAVAHDAVVMARLRGPAEALATVRRRRGAAYDPDVCDALLDDPAMLLGEGADDAWVRVVEA